ncbi:hypothetical protein [Peterkaempfera sp. SMS 1(5)a]|uniref:hypothetical protein n=1 Tax=Peterkaempfera podocarpi TaxID=3232308 RepID=UPI003670473A
MRWSIRKRSASSWVGGAPLHGVDELQLAVHQRLAAPGDVQKDRRDAAAQPGLLHRCLHGGPAGLVEGEADLADLIAAEGQRRRLDGRVHPLTGAQAAHHVRELAGGEPVRGVPESAQPA